LNIVFFFEQKKGKLYRLDRMVWFNLPRDTVCSSFFLRMEELMEGFGGASETKTNHSTD